MGGVAQDPPAPPTQAMARAVDLVTEMSAPGGPLRLALQVWSEAQRDPILAEFVATTKNSKKIYDIYADEAHFECDWFRIEKSSCKVK